MAPSFTRFSSDFEQLAIQNIAVPIIGKIVARLFVYISASSASLSICIATALIPSPVKLNLCSMEGTSKVLDKRTYFVSIKHRF